ncbi:uncharacterized protein SCHCODRAFT_02335628 [Schizophyllum commune H4-8]|uniref:uncharacterized protein n=1 Tax=Schizophyllum commune (strain H4-8 / FGSC 9210) TaxID=578458 RepID=UPI00215E478D|nr:uncharacterized protein SCHCODRAFT_02335628 [Schizophyllum commune H4-8]KAI5890072.1 hypothetical protein SCHCODRAFT_02335628 [Schizophyllum commune H4-8]
MTIPTELINRTLWRRRSWDVLKMRYAQTRHHKTTIATTPGRHEAARVPPGWPEWSRMSPQGFSCALESITQLVRPQVHILTRGDWYTVYRSSKASRRAAATQSWVPVPKPTPLDRTWFTCALLMCPPLRQYTALWSLFYAPSSPGHSTRATSTAPSVVIAYSLRETDTSNIRGSTATPSFD